MQKDYRLCLEKLAGGGPEEKSRDHSISSPGDRDRAGLRAEP